MSELQFSIYELRARNRMTQAEVAKKVGVSLTSYNAWEKSIANVTVSNVKKLADIFGVKLEDIKIE